MQDPQRTPAERTTVEFPVDAEGLAEPGGTGAEGPIRDFSPPPPHRVESGKRLQRANQDGRGITAGFGDGIQTPMHAVGEIDVGSPGRTIQLLGSGGATAVPRVAGGIVRAHIRFRLYDAAGGAAAPDVTDQDMSQKPTRDLGSGSRVECSSQRSSLPPGHAPPVSPRFTRDQNDSPSDSGSEGFGAGTGGGGSCGLGGAAAADDPASW